MADTIANAEPTIRRNSRIDGASSRAGPDGPIRYSRAHWARHRLRSPFGRLSGKRLVRSTRLGSLDLDHVLIAVADLASAGREIETRHGLASVEGGRHPGWGTANRIVPLGEAYLELIAVSDEAEAAQSPFGSWVAR